MIKIIEDEKNKNNNNRRTLKLMEMIDILISIFLLFIS